MVTPVSFWLYRLTYFSTNIPTCVGLGGISSLKCYTYNQCFLPLCCHTGLLGALSEIICRFLLERPCWALFFYSHKTQRLPFRMPAHGFFSGGRDCWTLPSCLSLHLCLVGAGVGTASYPAFRECGWSGVYGPYGDDFVFNSGDGIQGLMRIRQVFWYQTYPQFCFCVISSNYWVTAPLR